MLEELCGHSSRNTPRTGRDESKGEPGKLKVVCRALTLPDDRVNLSAEVKAMPEDATTRPTLDTVLERINALSAALDAFAQHVDQRFAQIEERLNRMEERLNQMDIRLDRTQAMVHEMSADFAEFRGQFKQPA